LLIGGRLFAEADDIKIHPDFFRGMAMNGKTTLWCSKTETFSATDKKRWSFLKGEVAQTKVETRELPNGYAFCLEGSETLITTVAEWVSYESRCCPFFNFEIALHRNHGPLWLTIWGGEGVKEFVNNLTLMKAPCATEKRTAPIVQARAGSTCCNTNRFTGTQKDRYTALNAKVNNARIETKDLPDGYTCRLRDGEVSLPELAEWLLLERLCCPFLEFGIKVEQDSGALWVKLCGLSNAENMGRTLQ
jgi:hypothetical protein